MTDYTTSQNVHPSAATSGSSSNWERATLEKIALAVVEEQRNARRWRYGLRLAWLMFFVAVFWLGMERSTPLQPETSDHTAVVKIRGTIMSGEESSADTVIESLRQAFQDKGAQAVVLVINSPGGSPVQAGMINDEIRRLKTLHNKPVYAVVEETCASAAYYIAVASDKIYVDKASIVGSIGVLMNGFGFTGLMEKLGIERRLLTAGENKGFLDPFSPQTDKQREYAQVMLNQIHQQFITVVKEGRGDRIKDNADIYSGLFWTGQEAIELGLADQLGSVDMVAREVVKAEKIIDYTQQENVAERLFKRFGASVGEGMAHTLRTMPSVY